MKKFAKSAASLLMCVNMLIFCGCDTVMPAVLPSANKELIKELSSFKMSIVMQSGISDDVKSLYKAAAEQINKQYGCKITYDFDVEKSSPSYMNSAKNTSYKVCRADTSELLNIIDNDYAADLTDALISADVSFDEPYYSAELSDMLNINYKKIGWGSPIGSCELPNCIIYNKTLLQKYGLDDPYELVSDGDWTFSKFKSYLEKADKAGFGKMEVSSPSSLFESICQAKIQPLVRCNTGSSPEYNLSEITVNSAISVFDKWFNEDKLCKADNGDGVDKLLSAKTAYYFADSKALGEFLQKSNISGSADFGVLPFPGEYSSRTYINVLSPQSFWYIPKKYEDDADKILFLQNELYKLLLDSNYNMFYSQVNFVFSGKQAAGAFNMLNSKPPYQNTVSLRCAYEVNASVGTNSLCGSIAGGDSAKTALEKYRKAIKTYYSENLKNYKYTGKSSQLI